MAYYRHKLSLVKAAQVILGRDKKPVLTNALDFEQTVTGQNGKLMQEIGSIKIFTPDFPSLKRIWVQIESNVHKENFEVSLWDWVLLPPHTRYPVIMSDSEFLDNYVSYGNS